MIIMTNPLTSSTNPHQLFGRKELRYYRYIAYFVFAIALIWLIIASCSQRKDISGLKSCIVMDVPGYPLIFEINKGDSFKIVREYKNNKTEKFLTLKDIRLYTEFNSWFPDSLGKCNYYKAEVDISVSGKSCTLYFQPYQMPQKFNGLKIYVEAVKSMDKIPNLDPVEKIEKDVRLSVSMENEPWGDPGSLEFPLNDYRWRSASYNNTWSALVPFNALYYHRGDDYGAIPDMIDICSFADGEVVQSPLPSGPKGSNSVRIRNINGITFDYHHGNYETIDTSVQIGRNIKKGQYIGKTGMTWNGTKSQHSDPHVHLGMSYNGFQISPFPYLIESYLRKYKDKVLAVAGGYRFVKTGDSLEIDATRSICPEGKNIKSYQWVLHDGNIVNKPVAKVFYPKSGYYSEELIVNTKNGDIDKDFLQVRVNDPDGGRSVAYGWAYYYPVRNIRPGQSILFWNRLINTKEEVVIDFGDGTAAAKIDNEIHHAYGKAGNYTVELSSRGINNEVVSVKLEVIVEPN